MGKLRGLRWAKKWTNAKRPSYRGACPPVSLNHIVHIMTLHGMLSNDSVFAKRVLTYWENRENSGYSHMNVLIVPMENYTFLER